MRKAVVATLIAVFLVSCGLFTAKNTKSEVEVTLKKVFQNKLDTGRSVKFSPDGAYFLMGVDSGFAIYVWNTKDMSLFKTIYLDDKYRNQLPIKNHQYRAHYAYFMPDSKSIFVSFNNGVAVILNLLTDSIEIYDFKVEEEHYPLSAISKSGKILAVGRSYLNRENNNLFNTKTQARTDLAITDDDKYVVSSFYHFCNINIFNTATGDRTNLGRPSLFGGTNVHSIDLSPDNDTIAACQRNGTIKLYSIRRKEEIGSFSHGGSNVEARFSPDGKFLASGSSNRKVKLWDVATKARKNTWKTEGSILFVKWLEGTPWFAVGTDEGELVILSTEKEDPVFRGKLMEQAIKDIDYLNSKKLLLVCDSSGHVSAFHIVIQ